MLRKLTISDVNIYEKSKDGELLTYVSKKDGQKKRYKKIRLSVEEMPDKLWGAIWDSYSPMNKWQPGEAVEVDVEQGTNGYWSFKLPNKNSELIDRLTAIEKRVDQIEKDLYEPEKNLGKGEIELDETELADGLDDEPKAEDLPF